MESEFRFLHHTWMIARFILEMHLQRQEKLHVTAVHTVEKIRLVYMKENQTAESVV